MRLRAAMWLLVVGSTYALAGCTTTVQIDGPWTAQCDGVLPADCEGIARLFAGNLARSSEGVRQDSGGRIFIAPAPCPAAEQPDEAEWADRTACWRAWAPTHGQRACMLVARQKDPAHALGPFGQIGGDSYTGLAGAPEPGTTPC